MDIDVTLSGYRCFSPAHPVTLALRGDTVALIGLNNSGKSTLLKSMYELRPLFKTLAEGPPSQLVQRISFSRPPEVGDDTELFWHFGEADVVVEVFLPESKKNNQSDLAWKAQLTLTRGANACSVTFIDEHDNPIPGHISTGTTGVFVGGKRLNEIREAFKLLSDCFYVPSVRHVTSFTPETGVGREGRFYDIYSGKSFIEAWGNRQQGSGKANTQLTREITNDIKRLFKYDDLEIQADQQRRELLITADGKSLRLGELGTGLAQFVLLLGNIAFAKPSYILIDEPESNLHPALQLQFIQSIASKARLGTVFATHSLGLARQAADRIFVLSRQQDHCEMTQLEETQNLAEVIGELSFGRADSIGTRGLLLVEGPHDIMTFEVLLAAFNKEDQYAILSLGGGGHITANRERELEHIVAISPRVVTIIDSEKSSEAEPLSGQRQNFLDTCQRLAIRSHVLERRAIENYLPQRAIDAAFPNHQYRSMTPYETRAGGEQWWPKRNNWRIARLMLKSEIEGTDLGGFLSSL